jgi:hypothetical protein
LWDVPRARGYGFAVRRASRRRAGRWGRCVSLITERDVELVHRVEGVLQIKLGECEGAKNEDMAMARITKVSTAMRMGRMRLVEEGWTELELKAKERKTKSRERAAQFRADKRPHSEASGAFEGATASATPHRAPKVAEAGAAQSHAKRTRMADAMHEAQEQPKRSKDIAEANEASARSKRSKEGGKHADVAPTTPAPSERPRAAQSAKQGARRDREPVPAKASSARKPMKA